MPALGLPLFPGSFGLVDPEGVGGTLPARHGRTRPFAGLGVGRGLVKNASCAADTNHMRISAEQATRTAHYLQTKGSDVTASDGAAPPFSDDFILRVYAAIESGPEVRPERVCAGRKMLQGGLPSADDVAESILRRMLADSLH